MALDLAPVHGLPVQTFRRDGSVHPAWALPGTGSNSPSSLTWQHRDSPKPQDPDSRSLVGFVSV